jgi:uncharacterized protein HemX
METSILTEVLKNVITAAIGMFAGGTFIHFKAKRKTENQKARQEENVADSGKFENLKKEIDYLGHRLEEYRTDQKAQEYTQKEQYRVIRGMQKIQKTLIGQKKYAEYHLCQDLACPVRIPTLGTFKSKDIEELIEESKKNEKDSM